MAGDMLLCNAACLLSMSAGRILMHALGLFSSIPDGHMADSWLVVASQACQCQGCRWWLPEMHKKALWWDRISISTGVSASSVRLSCLAWMLLAKKGLTVEHQQFNAPPGQPVLRQPVRHQCICRSQPAVPGPPNRSLSTRVPNTPARLMCMSTGPLLTVLLCRNIPPKHQPG